MGRKIYVQNTGGREDENKNSKLSEVIHTAEAGDIIQLTPGQTIILDELVMLDKSLSIMGNATEEKPIIVMEKNSAIVILSSYITISGITFIDKRTNSRTTPMFVVNSSSRNYVCTDNVVKYQKICMRINGEGFYVARNIFSRGDMNGMINSHVAIMITGTSGVNTIRENSFLSKDNNLRAIYISSEGTSTNTMDVSLG